MDRRTFLAATAALEQTPAYAAAQIARANERLRLDSTTELFFELNATDIETHIRDEARVKAW